MDYGDFYDFAVWANTAWNGSYTEKEIAENAYGYLDAYRTYAESELSRRIIDSLIEKLEESEAESDLDVSHWLFQIKEEIY